MSEDNNIPMIAHLVFRLDYGGLENGLVNLINNLPENEFEHSIICLTEYTEFSKRIHKTNVKIYAIHKKPGKDIWAYIRLYKLLRELKPIILHTRNLATIEGQVWAYFAKVPIRIHGEHGWDVTDSYGASWKYQLIRRACHPFVNKYVFDSTVSETFASIGAISTFHP